jgi:catechol 2,3-dioxygenase-like lactoylglutathione lyase family enzyme
MLGHVSFGVSDLERAIASYDAALAPLGLTRVWTKPNAVGYGLSGGGDILALKQQSTPVRAPGPGVHLAFNASARAASTPFIPKPCESAGPITALREFGRITGRAIMPRS